MAMSCYTDWKYIAAGDSGYAKGRNLLRYLQYRDDKINHIPRAGGPDRWVDCGLGGNWHEILDNATELQTDKVLLRTLIIRPPQDLVAGLEQGLAQIAQQVSESLERDRKQTVYLVRRTVDEALSSFLHGYSQMLDQREAQKKGRGRR